MDTDDEQIEQFIIYRWNRVYPADVSVEIGAKWKLTETEEFQFSHEKLQKKFIAESRRRERQNEQSFVRVR